MWIYIIWHHWIHNYIGNYPCAYHVNALVDENIHSVYHFSCSNLLSLKQTSVTDLGLTFSITNNDMGERQVSA